MKPTVPPDRELEYRSAQRESARKRRKRSRSKPPVYDLPAGELMQELAPFLESKMKPMLRTALLLVEQALNTSSLQQQEG